MVTRRECLIGMAAIGMVGPGHAQTWPSRPIRVIVPYPPGGANDFTARIYAERLPELLGQPTVVENKAGAGGEIGAASVATSTPDGYTLLFGAIGSLTIHAVIPAQKPPYELLTAFKGVSMGSSLSLALAVKADLPAKSVAELVSLAKSRSPGLTYGSAGNGSTQHMTVEYFQQTAGVKLTHVPYKGSAPAVADLLGGQIDLVFETMPALGAHLAGGKIRILAVTGKERSAMLPDIPTLMESGFPTFEVTTYYGLLVPSGTPAAVIDKLSSAMQSLAGTPDVQEAFRKQGALAHATSPAQTDELLRSEVEKWAKVQKVAKIQ
jgi:tripartite-type tricarboxylate transporter receptor subunit TctC